MAKLICSYCGTVIVENYETASAGDSHGVCDSCLQRVLSSDPKDRAWVTGVVEDARTARLKEIEDE